MSLEKVCVRIPAHRRNELLKIAEEWRLEASKNERTPGWDAKKIHEIAKLHFGGLEEMFAKHGWKQRGKEMMPAVQRLVKDAYGSVLAFEKKFPVSS